VSRCGLTDDRHPAAQAFDSGIAAGLPPAVRATIRVARTTGETLSS
jgi:hypothetical protein